MSPLDPEVPPAGEEIHLPGPSLQPLLLTVGLTVALIGVTTSPVISIIAARVLARRHRPLDRRHPPRRRRAAGPRGPLTLGAPARGATALAPRPLRRRSARSAPRRSTPSVRPARTMSRMDTIPRDLLALDTR